MPAYLLSGTVVDSYRLCHLGSLCKHNNRKQKFGNICNKRRKKIGIDRVALNWYQITQKICENSSRIKGEFNLAENQ